MPLSSPKTNNSVQCPQLDINDLCFVDTIATILQIGFSLLFTTIILILRCRRCRRRHIASTSDLYLTRLPGHTIRYFVSSCLVVILITSLAEGILSDRLNSNSAGVWTEPHLYIPFLIGAITLTLATVYYHHVEYMKLSRHFMLLLLLYWSLSLASEVLRLFYFIGAGRVSADVMRFDLNCALLATYCLLLSIEVMGLILQVSIFKVAYYIWYLSMLKCTLLTGIVMVMVVNHSTHLQTPRVSPFPVPVFSSKTSSFLQLQTRTYYLYQFC